MKKVYIETWTESESGWGTRPDGITLHLTEGDYKKYVEKYWEEELKRNPSGAIPHEYTRQDNNLKEVNVSEDIFKNLFDNKSNFGLRFWQSEFNNLIKKKQIIF